MVYYFFSGCFIIKQYCFELLKINANKFGDFLIFSAVWLKMILINPDHNKCQQNLYF